MGGGDPLTEGPNIGLQLAVEIAEIGLVVRDQGGAREILGAEWTRLVIKPR